MAQIDLTDLIPGKTYTVMVRAKDSNGNYSGNSQMYTFTAPSKTLTGTQLSGTNSTIVTALASPSGSAVGGALVAGGLDAAGVATSGSVDLGLVWNSTLLTASGYPGLTGTSSVGAVMINSTGILGYQFASASSATTSSGQANFYLSTKNGNAYFRGTVYAGAGTIGGWNIPTSNPYLLTSSVTYGSATKTITLSSSVSFGNTINDNITAAYKSASYSDIFFGSVYDYHTADIGFSSVLDGSAIISASISGTYPSQIAYLTIDTSGSAGLNPSFQYRSGEYVTISLMSGNASVTNGTWAVQSVYSAGSVSFAFVINLSSSAVNGNYSGLLGTVGINSNPYIGVSKTINDLSDTVIGYISSTLDSQYGFTFQGDGGGLIVGKTPQNSSPAIQSAVFDFQNTVGTLYIQPDGGALQIGRTDGASVTTVYIGNRQSTSTASLESGVILSTSGFAWMNRDTTTMSFAGLYVSNPAYSTGSWQAVRFLRKIGASDTTLSSTGYINVYNSGTIAPIFLGGSDYRLKTNITDAPDNFVEIIKSLRPVRFDEIAVPENKRLLGFIAHEVAQFIPEAVDGQKDEIDEYGNPKHQSLGQAKFIPYLVGALKESIIKIENLEQRLALLENK